MYGRRGGHWKRGTGGGCGCAMELAKTLGDAGCWAGMSFSLASRILRCALKRHRASSPPNSGLPPAPRLALGQAAGSVCTPAIFAGRPRESQLWLLALDKRPADARGPSRALIASIRPENATRPLLAGRGAGLGPAKSKVTPQITSNMKQGIHNRSMGRQKHKMPRHCCSTWECSKLG